MFHLSITERDSAIVKFGIVRWVILGSLGLYITRLSHYDWDLSYTRY